MVHKRRVFLFGILIWLIPFLVSFAAFPLRSAARPVFESVMSVTVTAAAVIFGLLHLRRVEGRFLREGLTAGLLWLVICMAVDAPLLLLGGPMKMSLAGYLGDIGLTYVGIPIVTAGLGIARAIRGHGRVES